MKGEENPAAQSEVLSKRARRILRILLYVPYFVGIIWHSLHPMVSVLTGDLSAPRRWYIDENSLEPSYFRMDVQYELMAQQHRRYGKISSLCKALEKERNDYICCFNLKSFELARIQPINGAIAPVTEAIVVVIPNSKDWIGGDQFHLSSLQLMRRLATAPWLSKTIFFVTATDESRLAETVDSFLEFYLGPSGNSVEKDVPSFKERIPTAIQGAMLRNLIVLEPINEKETGNEVRLLPQGRQGLLPNMDLTFLTVFVYLKSNMVARKQRAMVVHPYRERASELWNRWVRDRLDSRMHEWSKKLLELLCFEYSLAIGPYPPHSSALERGIDSISIQGALSAKGEMAEFVQKLEIILRSLSNLHERLHHSTSLYLLASPERFIKHEEYLVPNLLLVIPLVARLVLLVLVDIKCFCWSSFGWTTLWAAIGAVGCAVSVVDQPLLEFTGFASSQEARMQASVWVVYVCVFLLATWTGRYWKSQDGAVASIQVLCCFWTLLMHVAIAFGHVSLSFPSALFWTPLIAFPSYQETSSQSKVAAVSYKILRALWSLPLLFLAMPCNFLVPNVFETYTAYVIYGYTPLHLLLTLLNSASLLYF